MASSTTPPSADLYKKLSAKFRLQPELLVQAMGLHERQPKLPFERIVADTEHGADSATLAALRVGYARQCAEHAKLSEQLALQRAELAALRAQCAHLDLQKAFFRKPSGRRES